MVRPDYYAARTRDYYLAPHMKLDSSPYRHHFCKFDITFIMNDSNGYGAPDFFPSMAHETERIAKALWQLRRLQSIAISWVGYRGVFESTKLLLQPLKILPRHCTITVGRFSYTGGTTISKDREEFVAYVEELLDIKCDGSTELSFVDGRVQRFSRKR